MADTSSTNPPGIQPSSGAPPASQDTGPAAGGTALTSPHGPAVTSRTVAKIP
jgi:hypothetical protein